MESLSRGAARVLFVEKNGKAIDILRTNLRTLGDEAFDRGVVVRADAWDPPLMHRPLFGAARDEEAETDSETSGEADGGAEIEVAPDIIFLDPPYTMVAEDPVKSMARARRLLDRTADKGCVLFHFERGVLDEDDFDSDLDVDLREWGTSVVAMLWRQGDAPAAVHKRREKERAKSNES